MVNTKIWKFITPPWESEPQLTATLVQPSRVNGAKKKTETQVWRTAGGRGVCRGSDVTINTFNESTIHSHA